MTDTMIERVARVVCAQLGARTYDDLPEKATYLQRKTHTDWPVLDRQEARDMARAAIEAMREPTAEMKAAEGAHWDYSCHTCGGLAEGWYLMIDAALQETKG